MESHTAPAPLPPTGELIHYEPTFDMMEQDSIELDNMSPIKAEDSAAVLGSMCIAEPLDSDKILQFDPEHQDATTPGGSCRMRKSRSLSFTMVHVSATVEVLEVSRTRPVSAASPEADRMAGQKQ